MRARFGLAHAERQVSKFEALVQHDRSFWFGAVTNNLRKKNMLRIIISSLFLVMTLTACSMEVSQDRAGQIDAYLQQLTEHQGFSGSVLVSENGAVLLSEGYGYANNERRVPNTGQTRFRIHWITMQFTATAILMLHEQSELDVQGSICNYIRDCPDYWQGITIHHLLTHTSGVSDWIQPWKSEAEKPSTSSQLVDRLKDGIPYFKPGERFRYSNNGYVILGHIIEQVSGESYQKLLKDRIFEPLSMKNTGYGNNNIAVGHPSSGIEAPTPDLTFRYSASGLYSSVEDLHRWDQAIAGEKIISKPSLDMMFTGYAKTPSLDFPDSEYGYGWFIGRLLDRPMLAHGGMMAGFTSMILRFPDEQVTIIVLRNYELDSYDRLEIQIAEMMF